MNERVPRPMRALRITTFVLGAIALAGAFIIDRIPGLSSPGFGTAQWMLAALGVMLLVAAALGARFPAAYRGLALVAFNTVILVLVLELAIRAAGRIGRGLPVATPTAARTGFALPYYETQPWTEALRAETPRVTGSERYEPFALWKRAPFTGEAFNIDAEGRRVTPGSDCSRATVRVFAFGGSTMFGLGAPDDGTIPAQLQRLLGADVCVVNFGEPGFVSTQNVIVLLRQLQRGAAPHLVIFYDGVNDVLTGSLYRQAGLHLDANRIAWLLRGGASLPGRLLAGSRLANLVTGGRVQRFAEWSSGRFTVRDDLSDAVVADSIVAVYLTNLRAVRALGREYGFGTAFFWQPTTLTTRKPLHPIEQQERTQAWAQAVQLYGPVQERIARVAAADTTLHDLSTVFDTLDLAVFYDWHHLTPEGNRIVAEAMLAALRGSGVPEPPRDSAIASH